jgi:hypothetical protein
MGLPGGHPTDFEWGDATDLDAEDAQHHFPAMGVELVLQDGISITVCWGDAFGRFGLEVFALPALAVFHNRPAQSDVSEHRWWNGFVGTTISGEMYWSAGYADRSEPAPLVLRLTNGQQVVWLSASNAQDDDSLLLGMDGVTVSPRLESWLTDVVS